MQEIKGLIFDIQRLSLHDGPGIRTTVFLKGCPLRCLWCHNPESRSSTPQIAFYKTKCIGCGRCIQACTNDAIVQNEQRIDRAKCKACGGCAEACPSEALQLIGRVANVAEVLKTVMRDEPFYSSSGGGVTLSGGEPLHQFEFSHALLKAFKENGLHTAVETCGHGPWTKLRELAELTDLFLYDIKVIDPEKHKKLCGVDNAVPLENARRLAELDIEVIYRTPIVPGLNDSGDDLRLLGEFILSLPSERKLALMPYHGIGSGKYEALAMEYPLADIESPEHLDQQSAVLAGMGVQLVVD